MREREKTDQYGRKFACVPDAYGPEGRYRWVDSLPAGGQGHTELCEDTWSGGLVVVKGAWWRQDELDTGTALRTRSDRERDFRQSVQIQLELSNRTQSVPAVVEVVSEVSPTRRAYDALVPPGYGAPDINHESFLVMQFVGEADRSSRTLEDLVNADGRLDSADAVALADQVAAGLEAMHTAGGKGHYWAHSDLKPGNILVSGHPRRFTIIDHGAAQRVPVKGEAPEVKAATDQFAPPSAEERLTEWFDMYSLAATLVFALTQEPPGQDAKPKDIASDLAEKGVHPALIRLIATCLHAEAKYRINARAFRRELAAVNAFAATEVLSR
ncbi:protein kinase domain-containing protein [Streptomyces populi]